MKIVGKLIVAGKEVKDFIVKREYTSDDAAGEVIGGLVRYARLKKYNPAHCSIVINFPNAVWPEAIV